MTDKTLGRKKPGEKDPGTYHFNPGSMAGKPIGGGEAAGMASEGLERPLHQTERQIALGEEQILRQRAIIVDLEARGGDADSAKTQLQALEETQGLRVADRERLSKELISLQAAGG